MPRRSILSAAEREGLLAFPDTEEELIRHYTFSEPDMSAIRQRRGNHNRIGFAVQLCYLRYPGFGLPTDAVPPMPLLAIIGRQLHIAEYLAAVRATIGNTARASGGVAVLAGPDDFLYCGLSPPCSPPHRFGPTNRPGHHTC